MLEQNDHPSPDQLDQLERMVDVENLPYAEAREKLGMPPADNSMFTSDRIEARNVAHELHVQLYGVPETPGKLERTPEEQESIRRSMVVAHAGVLATTHGEK